MIYNKGTSRRPGSTRRSRRRPGPSWSTRRRSSPQAASKYGFAITGGGEVGNTVFRSLPFIWMNGGSIISDDMTKATVNEPAAVEAVKFYTDMLVKQQRLAALDAAERRHRQPPALHRRDGGDVPVRPVRHRLDPQGEPQHRHRRDDDPASGGQGDRGDPRRLELRHPEGREEPRGDEEVRRSSSPRRTTWASSPTRSRRATRRWSCRASRIRSSPTSRRCCRTAAACRRTRTGCRSRRPISTASSASCSATRTPQEAMDEAAEEIQALLDQ